MSRCNTNSVMVFFSSSIDEVMDTDGDEQLSDGLVSYSNKVLDLKKEHVTLSMNVTVSSHQ